MCVLCVCVVYVCVVFVCVCVCVVCMCVCCVCGVCVFWLAQEYGITAEEKLKIATQVCRPLLKKICSDLHHTLNDEVSDIIHRLDPMCVVCAGCGEGG